MKSWFKKLILPLIFIIGCFGSIAFLSNLGAVVLMCVAGFLGSVFYLSYIFDEYGWEIKSWFDRDGWK